MDVNYEALIPKVGVITDVRIGREKFYFVLQYISNRVGCLACHRHLINTG